MTARNNRKEKFGRLIGFARLLPAYTMILKEVCKGLTELTLPQKLGGTIWDDDLDRRSRNTDEQEIDDAISEVISGLKGLTMLQLGSYTNPPLTKTKEHKNRSVQVLDE